MRLGCRLGPAPLLRLPRAPGAGDRLPMAGGSPAPVQPRRLLRRGGELPIRHEYASGEIFAMAGASVARTIAARSSSRIRQFRRLVRFCSSSRKPCRSSASTGRRPGRGSGSRGNKHLLRLHTPATDPGRRRAGSPSTARVDRARKLHVYARERVPHRGFVDPLARTVEVY